MSLPQIQTNINPPTTDMSPEQFNSAAFAAWSALARLTENINNWSESVDQMSPSIESALAFSQTAATKAGEAGSSAQLAEQWANQTEDIPVESGKYSAKHYAAKADNFSESAEDARDKAHEWANKNKGSAVENGEYSSKHWSEVSKDWATRIGGAVESGEYSAKQHAITAKDWAQKTGGVVADGEYSAKHYSQQAAAEVSNAQGEVSNAQAEVSKAKKWATQTNAPVEGGNYGAKYYAQQTQADVDKARDWAEEDHNVEVEPGKYSAYHWAMEASEVVGGGVTWGTLTGKPTYIAAGSSKSNARAEIDAVANDDARLSDDRDPNPHAHNVSDISATGTASSSTFLRGDGKWEAPTNTDTTYTAGSGLDLNLTEFSIKFGTQANEAVEGNDGRLSDARDWTASLVTKNQAEDSDNETAYKWTPKRVWQAIAKWWSNTVDTNTSLGSSDSKVPSQKAVKAYVDNKMPDAVSDGSNYARKDGAWNKLGTAADKDIGGAVGDVVAVGYAGFKATGVTGTDGRVDNAAANWYKEHVQGFFGWYSNQQPEDYTGYFANEYICGLSIGMEQAIGFRFFGSLKGDLWIQGRGASQFRPVYEVQTSKNAFQIHPVGDADSTYTFTLEDAGGCRKTNAKDTTIPSKASVGYADGTMLMIYNKHDSNPAEVNVTTQKIRPNGDTNNYSIVYVPPKTTAVFRWDNGESEWLASGVNP